MHPPKKLIEVSMPLDHINEAAIREKSIRHGHPSAIHLWWARRPLAAVRAVLFAQMVNDPGGDRGYGAYRGQTKEDAAKERERLFEILRELVEWESTNNEEILNRAREEITRSWEETCKVTGNDPRVLPSSWDPFSGGGAIPLEAQRLGLDSHGSDLNPVAVMIGKAMIEYPGRFPNRPPIGPLPRGEGQTRLNGSQSWDGISGLAEDVWRYGCWMREEALTRIGHLYPKADLPKGYGNGKATVIAWLWARTVTCPNPACGAEMPLVSSFKISTKRGVGAFIKPTIVRGESPPRIQYEVRPGVGGETEGTVGRGGARCLACDSPVSLEYLRSEGEASRMGAKLLAIVAEGERRREYLSPTEGMERLALDVNPEWEPETDLPEEALGFRVQRYGITRHRDLFSNRQLVALTTFSDLVDIARNRVIVDAKASGWTDDGTPLRDGGKEATAYGDLVAIYLAFLVDQIANHCSSNCGWNSVNSQMRSVFARHALPMVWDYAESNPFSNSSGSFNNLHERMVKGIRGLRPNGSGTCFQSDARFSDTVNNVVISTDPPYYDNIGYSDLSDFFYVWLRRSLRTIFPEMFATLLVPKEGELVANPFRHGGKTASRTFFLAGMTDAMRNLHRRVHPDYPLTLYYAFKQSEVEDGEIASGGWDTFLAAVIEAGFIITGTWPLRTEKVGRMRDIASNALASSIVLVCRRRPPAAQTISRRQFIRELESELPSAIETMIGGSTDRSPIAPVDLAQAAIGPGMAVFSRYEAVLEADGTPMAVRAALMLINKAIDEYFTEAESSMGAETRFCVDWFQQYSFRAGPFGEADVLARAKGTSVEGVHQSGVLESGGGKIRLLRVDEYSDDWNPKSDKRKSVWEACHNMIRAVRVSESIAGALLSQIPEMGEPIRQLAYRLYKVSERKRWSEEALMYNELITSWRAILEVSRETGRRVEQADLFD